MNLHGIASGAIASVNPFVPCVVRASTGYTIEDEGDGRQIPSYADPVTVPGQVQPLSTGDIRQIDALNIQGVERAIYLNGFVSGLVRIERKGGDLITVQSTAFAGSIAGNVLTVDSVAHGRIAVGDQLFGSGVTDGVTIESLGTGTGGAGTYVLSAEFTLAQRNFLAGAVWLVVVVLEQWPDWCKVGVALQDGT